MPVEGVETLEFFAGVGKIQPAVSEYAVHIKGDEA